MSDSNESTPKAIRELLDPERAAQFTDGGILEMFIHNEREGGGEIKKVEIKNGEICVTVGPFFQKVGGIWIPKVKYTFALKGSHAWRDGQTLVVYEEETHTTLVLRISYMDMLKRHEAQQHKQA